jgi:hypothetical protein
VRWCCSLLLLRGRCSPPLPALPAASRRPALHAAAPCPLPPAGELPPARVSLHHFEGSGKYATREGIRTPGPSAHCRQHVSLRDIKPSRQSGDYYAFDIPLDSFECSGDFVVNKVDVVLDVEDNYRFCMDEVKLLG